MVGDPEGKILSAYGVRWPRQGGGLRELPRPVTAVVATAHSPPQEVARGAADVEDQVAHGVAGGVGSPPDLVVGEGVQSRPHLGGIAPHQTLARILQEYPCEVVHANGPPQEMIPFWFGMAPSISVVF